MFENKNLVIRGVAANVSIVRKLIIKPMKTLALLALALTLATSQAADKPAAEFPLAGETYKIATASPLAETPYENRVTILALGEHQWARVQYEVATRAGGKEKKEMWVNFAHVTSAVKADAGK